MKRPIPGGLLVAVEGIDGAGKTSIATVLAQWCGERGLNCIMSKEPTGLKWGQELRASAREGRLSLERELELFELDRREHVQRSIAPALKENNIVILDRYYWSTAAYQGIRGADYREIIAKNESFAPKPDLILVLNIDVDLGLGRIRSRGDTPNLFETKAALLKARNIFLQLAEQSPNATVIDSSGVLKETADPCLRAFIRTALNKISGSAPLHPEMLNLTLEFMGEDRLEHAFPPGTAEIPEALRTAREVA